MRHPLRYPLVLLLTVLAACGGDSGNGPNGGPVTLVVEQGNDQVAPPASALPVDPVIVARDGGGKPVAGLTVTFSVAAGGGTIATGSATTAADGSASPGSWTLGAFEGPNVVTASSAGLTSVQIRAVGSIPADTLAAGSIGTGGGTITVSVPGHPLDGTELVVPGGAFPQGTDFTIAAKQGPVVPLPAGYTQLGPALAVSTTGVMAAVPMKLTLPITATADTALAAFFFDPVSGAMELVPAVARTATSYSLSTRHFTASQLLTGRIPSPAAPRIAGSRAAFGEVEILLVAIPVAQLPASVSTTFAPGQDDWEFTNFGTIPEAGGICAGMTLSAMYYHYALRNQGALFSRYNVGRNDDADAVGLRLATAVQGSPDWGRFKTFRTQIANYELGSTTPADVVYYQSLVMAMKLTGLPQWLAVWGQGFGHALVAFGISGGQVSFADPNYPGLTRTMQFSGNAFQPFPFAATSGAGNLTVTSVNTIGVSALLDVNALATLWSHAADSTAGRDRFPAVVVERLDTMLGNSWLTLDSLQPVLLTSVPLLHLRVRCPGGCPYEAPTATPPDQQFLKIIDQAGTTLATVNGGVPAPVSLALSPGTRRIGIATYAISSAENDLSWTNFRWLDVNYAPVGLEPRSSTVKLDSIVAFRAQAGDLLPAVTRFTWDFGDGTAAVNSTGNANSHKFSKTGFFTVRVSLFNAADSLVGKDSATVSVGITTGPYTAWALKNIAVSVVGAPVTPGPNDNVGTRLVQKFGEVQAYWARPTTSVVHSTLWFVKQATTLNNDFGSAPIGVYLSDSLPGTAGAGRDPYTEPYVLASDTAQKVADDPLYYPKWSVTGNPPDSGRVAGLGALRDMTIFSCIGVFNAAVYLREVDFSMLATTGHGSITYTFRDIVPSCNRPLAVVATWQLVVNFDADRVR